MTETEQIYLIEIIARSKVLNSRFDTDIWQSCFESILGRSLSKNETEEFTKILRGFRGIVD